MEEDEQAGHCPVQRHHDGVTHRVQGAAQAKYDQRVEHQFSPRVWEGVPVWVLPGSVYPGMDFRRAGS